MRKMDSSRVAFERFGTWKKSMTVLKLTVWANGGIRDIWNGSISTADEDDDVLVFIDEVSRRPLRFDTTGDDFTLDERSVRVSRNSGEDLVFEEVLPS
jgi:hypothetical protein